MLRALLDPPWSLRIEDEAPLTVLAVLRGVAWLCPADGPTREHARGSPGDRPRARPLHDRRPAEHAAAAWWSIPADAARAPPTAAGCGTSGRWASGPGGIDADASCVLLVGTYEGEGEASRPLLSALPDVVLLGPGELDSAAPGRAGRRDAGRGAGTARAAGPAARRPADRHAAHLVRRRQESEAPGWFRAQHDPVVAARRWALLHDDVAHPWTVAELAARVGVSRAALARRFTGLVGEPPMAYLASWRLALAADLLCSSDATVSSVARTSRLRDAVLAQHRVQARVRRQPAAVPPPPRRRAGPPGPHPSLSQRSVQAFSRTTRRIDSISSKCSWSQTSGGASWMTGSPRSSARQ